MVSFKVLMLKELILAIILGSILGFGVTGGFITLKKSGKPNLPPSSNAPTPTISAPNNPVVSTAPTPSFSPELPENNINLTIDEPLNESIVANSKTTIKGTTAADSHLVVATPLKVFTLTADSQGYFETEVELESGVNLIQVNSSTPDNFQYEKELIVTYSTAKI
ncbi:MAG: hypothetical protein WC686_05640 [Candidatus Shapirobacteria bacterium]|jgi:hypothetical protein